jgi:hypothetical protein
MGKWKDKYSSNIKDTCSFYWPVDLDNYKEKSKSKNLDQELDKDKEQYKFESYIANKIIKSWKALCIKIQSNKYKYMKENVDINDFNQDYSIRYSSRYLIEYKNIYKDKYLINLKKEQANPNDFILEDIIHKKIIKNIQIENVNKKKYNHSNSYNNYSNFYYENYNSNNNFKPKSIPVPVPVTNTTQILDNMMANINYSNSTYNNLIYTSPPHIDTKYLNQIESILDNISINLYIY